MMDDLKSITQNRILTIFTTMGLIFFIGTAGFSWYQHINNAQTSKVENNTSMSLDAVSVIDIEGEIIEDKFNYDYEGLYITRQLQEQGIRLGLISSILNTELGFKYPITIDASTEKLLALQYPQSTTKTLEEVIPAPVTPIITNRLIWPEYGINAPIIYSSLTDLFMVDNNELNFSSYVDNNPIGSPIQTKLTQGTVHLAYSPLPGEIGNSYIVGHSSNFSSVKSNYNEVFKSLTRQTQPGEMFTIYDHKGRELKFRVFESLEVRSEELEVAYNNYPKDKRVVTLQGSILEEVNGKLEPTKRWLTRGELIQE